MDFDELKRIAESGGMRVMLVKRDDGTWDAGWMRGNAFGAPPPKEGTLLGANAGGYVNRDEIVEMLRKIILSYAKAANTDQGREAAILLE